MRRKEKEIKSKTEIDSIIRSGKVCRIAFSNNDEPYIVPMYYGYKDNNLFFHSAREGRKIEMIKKNNLVCFEIDISYHITNTGIPCDWKNKYKSVIGFGKATIVNDYDEKVKIVAKMDLLDNEFHELIVTTSHEGRENETFST